MALTQRQQLQRLLGDIRGHTWDTSLLTTRLARAQAETAEQAQTFETRALLTLQSGVRTYTLPSDHLQTYAVVRATSHVALRLYDSASVAWYLQASTSGALSCTNTLPVGEVLALNTTTKSLRLTDSGSNLWYLYPSTLGVVTTNVSAPSGTQETRPVQLRDGWGTPWYPTVSLLGAASSTTTGSATLAAPDVSVTPLVRLESEGLAQVDPTRVTGPPRYWTLEGTTLRVDPVPDQDYEAEHWYYTTSSSAVGAEWQTPVLLRCLAQLLHQTQGWPPAQAVLQMADQETAHLAALGMPDERDALESLRQPVR